MASPHHDKTFDTRSQSPTPERLTEQENAPAVERLACDPLTLALFRHFQKQFPLIERPFSHIAELFDLDEENIIRHLNALYQHNLITRIGPIFDHRRAGASILAAIHTKPGQQDHLAEVINRYAEVNHNYARSHFYNLWFVVTAPDKQQLNRVLNSIEQDTHCKVLRLPMEKSYHIDLSFPMDHATHSPLPMIKSRVQPQLNTSEINKLDDSARQKLRALIETGIPICSEPFEVLAKQFEHHSASDLIACIQSWEQNGLIKRFGLISNHHKLGYTENAMVVWNVAEEEIDRIGNQFRESGRVSLCYKRARTGNWPYNLYCMIHSRCRTVVRKQVQQLIDDLKLQHINHEILFCTHQYKQTGGRFTHRKQSDLVSGEEHDPMSVKQG